MLSGGTNDSTSAPAAGEPETQSNTVPAIRVRGMVVPVEKKVAAPVFLTLPRISASPFCMMTVYAVLGRHPFEGFTPMTSRCHDAVATPLRGDIKKRSAKVMAAGGRSATTSSKRKRTSLGRTPTVPESGVTLISCGAATSGG